MARQLIVWGLLISAGLLSLWGFSSPVKSKNMETTESKMKVEIWSDVMCPFCYIGKRKFEKALENFSEKDQVEIIWRSFQLAPDMVTDPDKNINEYLAAHKGISLKEATQLNQYVTKMAAKEGLIYNFDKAVVANSFNAHRFTHFAKTHGKQDEAEELLFRSYFTDGKNIDNDSTLISLGKSIGLDAGALEAMLKEDTYAREVKEDLREASEVGLTGVPFFVFNRKYSISGAQDSKVFLQALKHSFAEWKEEQPH